MDNFFKQNREKELCVYLPKKAVSQFFIALIVMFGGAFTGSGQLNAQCVVTCNSDVQVSLFNPSNFTVTYDMVLVNSGQGCPGGNFLVQIFNEAGQNIGNQVNASHIGVPLSVLVTNTNNGNSCSANLSVVDDLPPVITCQNKFVSCSGDISPAVLGYPGVSDNITPLDSSDLEYTDVFRPQTCTTMVQDSAITAKVDRIWRVTDGSGNLTTKVQSIYYVRRTFDDIVFPKNRDGQQAPYLKCQRDNPSNLALTGTPTIDGKSIHGTGHCDFGVTFTDDVIINCAGEKEIRRRWCITDWCLDSVITRIQLIVVRDELPPMINCPDTLFLSTNPNACTATVTLPVVTATDSCSTPTVSVRWQFGAGYGPFYAVPTGNHKVTYTAADACGNVTTCATTVVVKDNQPPTAICAQSKEIILQPDGTALAFANSFDGGSHDNCGIDGFAVARDNLPFSNTVRFTCADIGKNVVVRFRVVDRNNFFSECTVNVKVLDRTAPVLVCPANKTIACKDDPANLILTGMATASDACSPANISFTDNTQLNNCGTGSILRTWKATDASGNFATCVQQITVLDNTPVTVVFPDDYVSSVCGANTSPDVTGRPVLTGDDCEDIEVTFTEQYFGTAPPACFRIIRRWVVVDWCQYAPGSGSTAGYWSKDQSIQVVDGVAPVLTVPADQFVGTENISCEGIANIPLATATDCAPNVSIRNNSPYSTTKGADASGTYPPGVHVVTFTATDGCGNQSTATMKITVADNKAPTPICGNGISLSLNSDGILNLHPLMVLTGSFDNCSPNTKLTFDITPKVFDCSSVGPQTVRITAKDEAGNTGFCTTTVNIQDNLNACSNTGTSHIAGTVMTMGGTPGVLVQVELSGGLSAGRQTNVDGSFEFRDLQKNKSYTVTPRYNTGLADGVTTFDLVMMQKHILNVENFTTPFQWIAADANKSGDVTTYDMVLIRKAVLRVITEFPNNKAWRFVDAGFQFPAVGNPLRVSIPETIQIANLTGHRLDNDFVAVKIGDINGSARLNTLSQEPDDRSTGEPLQFQFEDQDLQVGQVCRVDLSATNFENISGFQFTLDFDKNALAFDQTENMSLNSFDDRNVGTALLDQGSLTLSWNDFEPLSFPENQALFSLHFTAKKAGKLSEFLNASSQYTPAEAYQQDLRQGSTIQATRILDVALRAKRKFAEGLEILPNRPNPFTEWTTIPMHVPKTMDLTLTIFDLYGREIVRMKKFFPMGYHEWKINEDDLQHRTGLFLFRMEGEGVPAKSGKMTRLRNE